MEAYLENVLILLTSSDPSWMRTKDKITISGADVLEIERTLDTEKRWQGLMALVRQRWVKQFLSGSPADWIARLKRKGALEYRACLAEDMKTVWDRRHVIVHAPPVVSSGQPDGLNEALTARFVQSKSALEDAMTVIYSFVNTTDAFVVGVLKA